ncbi:uncharacterized protein LOC141816992 [Curcuma longa]|uniref:uncharacterized protein LOC141816992 n=1 Tax=Curcuma longa TaxID=136217 RepID=UPI003D9FA47C
MGVEESTDRLSHLKLEIRVDRLSNFNLDLSRDSAFFVRYYVVSGKGQRIRVDTREVFPSVVGPVWDEVATMECQGRVGEVLEPHAVVFELRRRRTRTRTLFFSGSRLLGRAEVAWKEVLAAPEKSLRRCVGFGSLSSEWSSGLKPPGLLVELKVEAMELCAASVKQKRIGMEKCGCEDSGGFGNEEEMLLAAATLNAW